MRKPTVLLCPFVPAAFLLLVGIVPAQEESPGKVYSCEPVRPRDESHQWALDGDWEVGVAVGLIAGNVYLFAAAQGLAAWFHNCDKSQLSTKLNLRKDQRVLFGQTVGYRMKRQISMQVQS